MATIVSNNRAALIDPIGTRVVSVLNDLFTARRTDNGII